MLVCRERRTNLLKRQKDFRTQEHSTVSVATEPKALHMLGVLPGSYILAPLLFLWEHNLAV